MELQEAGVLEMLQVHSQRLDDGNAVRHGSDPLEAGQGLLHVVQHTEVQDDIERPEPGQVDRGEVGRSRFH